MEFYLIAISCLLALVMAGSIRAGYLAGQRARLKAGNLGEHRVSQLLDTASGQDRLDGIVVGSRFGRSAQIDHLVRGPRGFVVVETKNWTGVLEGGPQDKEWTLTRSNGVQSHRRNPLLQAARQARIVSEKLGNQAPEIKHIVVMAGRVSPKKSFPDGVIYSRELSSVLPVILSEQTSDSQLVEQAWNVLVEHAYEPDADKRARRYIARLEERFGAKPWRSWLVVAFALASLAWTMALCITALQMKSNGTMM